MENLCKMEKQTIIHALFLFAIIQLPSCQEMGTLTINIDLQRNESDKEGKQWRLSLIGDSISTFNGYLASDTQGYDGIKYKTYYPKGDVNNVEFTWWYQVASSLSIDLDNVCNCAWSASRVTGNSFSTSSAEVGCSTRRIQDLSAKGFDPDIVLCYISCNDWAGDVSVGEWSATDPIPEEGNIPTFREAYALMLYKIKSFYPKTEIFCLTNLEDVRRDRTAGPPSNNNKGVSVGDWNNCIKEVATSFNCHVIDLSNCGINYDNALHYTLDGGLHPNRSGMSLIAKYVTERILIEMN